MIREPGLLEKVLAAEVKAQPMSGGSSLRRDTIRNILRQRSAIVGLVILAILFLTAIFAPLIATHDPILSLRDVGETNITRGDPPCIHALGCALDKPQHLFGIDSVIRDEFSRVVYGSRISLQIGFITVGFAIIARMTRSSLLEVLGLDFVRTARAKGLKERSVVVRHGMRNALLPVVTVIGLSLGAFLSGAILTETIFNLTGMGKTLFEAISGRDYIVIQGVTIVVAVAYLVVNLIVDISYAFLDPRIRLE